MSIKDPCDILQNSTRTPEGYYVHNVCGADVIGKFVYLAVVGVGPNGSGSGEVEKVVQPCCLKCGIEPDTHQTVDYSMSSRFIDDRIVENL